MEIIKQRASALIIKDRRILLLHRLKYGEDFFVFPGGRVEEGETPEAAMIREVMEETSLTVLSCKFAFEVIIPMVGKQYLFFLCQTSNGTPRLGWPETDRQNNENIYLFEWHKLDKVKDLNLLPSACKERFCLEYSN